MTLKPALLIATALLLSGCGYVGEPLPPLLRIPVPVTDLAAVQRGSRIVVQFTVPRLTTEGTVLRNPPQLDLRAGPGPNPFDAGAWAAHAKPLGEGPVEGGRARYEVPADAWAGREIVFGVRAVGSSGRDGGWSNFVVVAVVPPPQRPEDVRAEPVAEGVHLAWQGQTGLYRVFRRGPGEQSFNPAADATQPTWTDTATEYGKTYEYLVQRIVKTATGEAESEPSASVRVTPVDRFPPAVPTGLKAVAATTGIALAWERNGEPDFGGYRVYRAAPGAELKPIADTGQTPSYTDRTVEAGKVYRYAVSALDASGNESRPSDTVEVTAP
ncbi:MAG TPA: hypothetical protein VN442_04505 [Bryobacteraceae bacterium]|nr:hypothetical protein [Bryobacteraceae bacterium]